MGTFTQFWTIWSENDLDDSFLQHIKVKIYLKSNTSRERAHRERYIQPSQYLGVN